MLSQIIDPRTVSALDFPAAGTPAQQWEFLLNYALLAPSEYNTQPWLFKIDGARVTLFADASRRLPIVDPDGREMLMSCGAALFNLRVALRHFGYQDEVELHPDINQKGWQEKGEWLARIQMGKQEQATREGHSLFTALALRRSNRLPFFPQGLGEAQMRALEQLVREQGCWLRLLDEEADKRALAHLIVAGDRALWSNKLFRQELANWVHPRHEESVEGMPGSVHGRGSIGGGTLPYVVRTFDLWRTEADKDLHLIATAPVLAVLGTFADTPGEWLQAGQTMQHLLLQAWNLGIQSSFLNQPIEIPSLRTWLTQLVGKGNVFSQLVMRLGYGPEAPLPPRRRVRDVLLHISDS